MTCYLLHFDKPISPNHTCQHYLGYSDNLVERLIRHRKGNGARLVQVANERGIKWKLVKIWPDGDRKLERKLKNWKNSPRLCPICTITKPAEI
jgi:predicted GIY-YIG superfamily endonuclease